MKSELLARSPMLALPLIALLLFVVVFVAMFVVTMKKRAPLYDPLARMPLDDEANGEETASDEDEKGARR